MAQVTLSILHIVSQKNRSIPTSMGMVMVVMDFPLPMGAAGSSPRARTLLVVGMRTRSPRANHQTGARVWRCHTLGEGDS